MKFKKIICTLFLFTFLSISNISINAAGWGYQKNKDHITPNIGKYAKIIEGTSSYYVGNTNEKVVYLTFDAGYDNGELIKILNTLKNKEVQASFFVTGDFVKRFSDLVLHMEKDNHIVCNHSYSHKKIQNLTLAELSADLKKLETEYTNLTCKPMVKYFRPPEGEFSREALLNLQSLGYKTIFWSIAYRDWEQNKQVSSEQALSSITNNLHPGAIILLHTVSKTNSQNLDKIIDEIRSKGYTFKTVLDI